MTDTKKRILKSLRTSRSQIDAVIKMIEDNKYDVEVSNQIMAAYSLLKSANLDLLEVRLHDCVSETFDNKEEREEKVCEVIKVIKRMIQ